MSLPLYENIVISISSYVNARVILIMKKSLFNLISSYSLFIISYSFDLLLYNDYDMSHVLLPLYLKSSSLGKAFDKISSKEFPEQFSKVVKQT